MEYAGHGDLLEYIKLRGAIEEDKARPMFKQICSAIDYLHQNRIVHRWVRRYYWYLIYIYMSILKLQN